jgi:hypothetical protein
MIEQLLKADDYEARLPALLKAKQVVTDELNFVLRIQAILQNPALDKPLPLTLKTIKPIGDFA